MRRKPAEILNDECAVATVKHGGGSVMVWEMFCGREGNKFDSALGNQEEIAI